SRQSPVAIEAGLDSRESLVRSLQSGVTLPDKSGAPVLYRYLHDGDDIVAITEMLHESYAPLASAGMRFVASHQHPETTRLRMNRGETVLALANLNVVGVITLNDACRTE